MTQRDLGHTRVEMVAVLAILGVLGSAVALMVTGITTQASTSGCRADARALDMAATNFLASDNADSIPATGSDLDRYERTLAERGFLRAPSANYDLTASGALLDAAGSSC